MIVFLVGLGAPAALYRPFLETLNDAMPNTTITTVEWWKEADSGLSRLRQLLQPSSILIGHSGGGVTALRALNLWPEKVGRIVMLDSHQIHHVSKLPSIDAMLAMTIGNSSEAVSEQVKQSYVPVKQNSTQFYNAFTNVVDWVNTSFAETCETIAPHQVLHIGFTDSNYKIFDNNALDIEQQLWGKFGMDVKAMPMNHFDLIAADKAKQITDYIKQWLFAGASK